jgi:hypothetical protein
MSEVQNTPPENDLQGEDEVKDLEVKDEDPSEVKDAPKDELDESHDEDSKDNEEGEGKKKSGIQRRFAKFQAKLDAQMQELEYWKKVAIEGGKQSATNTSSAPSAPKLADFDNVEDYIAARESHLKQELLQQLSQEAKAKVQEEQVFATYDQRVQQAQTELKDWADVMAEAADEPTTPETLQFCLESEAGPKIAYYLAKNPEVNDRLNSLSPARRLAELGKLEDKLMTPKSSAPAAKAVTKAPTKMSDVKGTIDSNKTLPASTGEARSYSEWKAIRERQKAKR